MDEFNSDVYRHHRSSGQSVGGVINGTEFGATNMYVVRSSNHFSTPYGTYSISKPATLSPAPAPARVVSSPWYDCRQLKRRKRIAKYKLYAVEGKVKRSLKNSFRWIKRTCGKIAHGI